MCVSLCWRIWRWTAVSGRHEVNCSVQWFIHDFEEFLTGVFLSYLQFCISNKISKWGGLRSCGEGREHRSPNTGGSLLLLCLRWSSHILVRLQMARGWIKPRLGSHLMPDRQVSGNSGSIWMVEAFSSGCLLTGQNTWSNMFAWMETGKYVWFGEPNQTFLGGRYHFGCWSTTSKAICFYSE